MPDLTGKFLFSAFPYHGPYEEGEELSSLFQLLVTGISLGFIYALVSIAYTLIFNTTGLVNFSHERFIVLGAYIFAGTMLNVFPGNFPLAVIGTLLCMMLYGVLIANLVFIPLSKLPFRIFAMAGTLFLGIVMKEGIRLIWGPAPFTINGWLSGIVTINGAVISNVHIYIITFSIALLIAQRVFFTKTRTGKALTVVSQDKEVAALMGINVKRNISLSIGISSLLCGCIGLLVIPLFSVYHTMASSIGMKGFCAGVVGGFGSIGGAVMGGLFIGIIENLYLLIGPSTYKDVVAFALLIIFLIVNPGGFIGIINKKRIPLFSSLTKYFCKNREVGE